jgi:hypothetical protein
MIIFKMLTHEEEAFIRYWEQNRSRQKKIFRQFLIGIPVGLLFVIPIAINFASGWDRRADMEANSGDFNPIVLLIALLLIVAFTAIFYRQHRWDQYEQRYRELLAREPGAGDSGQSGQTAPGQTGGVDPDQSEVVDARQSGSVYSGQTAGGVNAGQLNAPGPGPESQAQPGKEENC